MRSPPGKERALDRSSRALTPPSRALPARSYNVAHYYANRNFTGETSTSTLAKSYAAAVTFSIGSALAIERAARVSSFQRQLRYAGPLAAVSAATFVNMGMMRQSELLEGVVVKDELGDELGASKAAGRAGIGICVASRILAALVPMTVPTILTENAKATFLKASPRLHVPFYFATLAVAIQAWTPVSLGAFRQHTSLDVGGLEPEFQDRKMRDGRRVERAYFNRGM